MEAFYIVSSWFLAMTAALGREGGGIPEEPGRTKEDFTMMGWYGGGMGSLGVLAMGLFWFILLGLIVWLVVRLLPGIGDQPNRPTGESALEILDRRLAGGELDLQAWQAQRGALLAAQGQRK
jgi:putative membrane protein